jgi:hypothetical protein
MDLMEKFYSVRDAFWRLPLPAKIVIGVSIGSAALILVTVILRLALWWGSSGQATVKLEPRIAQMLGYLNAREEIAGALEARSEVLASAAFLDSGDSGRGGALLQQEIRKLAASSALTVIGSEVREPELLEDLAMLRGVARKCHPVFSKSECVSAIFIRFYFVDKSSAAPVKYFAIRA